MSSTRRTFLAAAAMAAVTGGMSAVGSGSAAAATGAAAATDRPVPGVTGRRCSVTPGVPAAARAAGSPTHLSLSWTGPQAPRLHVRGASGWRELTARPTCSGGSGNVPGGAGAPIRSLVSLAGASGYVLDDAVGGLVEIDAMAPSRAAAGPRTGELTSGAPYRTRAGWGADESLRFAPDGSERFPPTYSPTQTVTVHHTVTSNDDPDPAATLRAIYYDQTITRDFGDVGYHLIIDSAGTVYEGRWSGTDGVPVFGPPAGGLPQMADAAHVAGYNAGNVGVALLGDFTDVTPTAAAQDRLVDVLTALCTVCRLDPTGRTDYVNPISGATRRVDTIAGHRDWAATECPGNLLYPLLPDLRRRVAGRLGRAG